MTESVRAWVIESSLETLLANEADTVYLWNRDPMGWKTVPGVFIPLTPENIEAMRETVRIQMKAFASPKEILTALGITGDDPCS